MLKISSLIVALTTALLLSACSQPSSEAMTASGNTEASAAQDLNALYDRIEKKIHITDNEGHGPDIGSGEWCSSVNRRLENNPILTAEPCSEKWANQVIQLIDSMEYIK